MTEKARSPSVECRVTGTVKAAVDAERSLCLGRKSNTLVKSQTGKPDQDHGDSDMIGNYLFHHNYSIYRRQKYV